MSSWIFGNQPLEHILERIGALGYDAVELKGEPGEYPLPELKSMLLSRGLSVSSICGMYPGPAERRDLAHPNKAERTKAVDYVRACIDLAAEVNAPVVIVSPNPVGKTKPLASKASELEWAKESVHSAGEHAGRCGVVLAVEPINRYETYLLNSAEQALTFVRDLGLSSVKMMLDTFHMNIEDPAPGETVARCADELVHLHIADSNRQAVGRGHFDFKGLLRALQAVRYEGALAMEPLPPLSDPYQAMHDGYSAETLELFLRECLERLNSLQESLPAERS